MSDLPKVDVASEPTEFMGLDDLIGAYSAPEETYTIKVPVKGKAVQELKFRYPANHSDYSNLTKSAAKFARKCVPEDKTAEPSVTAELKPFVPSSVETAAKAYILHAYSVEPKISLVQALKMSKEAPILFEALLQSINMETTMRNSENLDEELGEGKDD